MLMEQRWYNGKRLQDGILFRSMPVLSVEQSVITLLAKSDVVCPQGTAYLAIPNRLYRAGHRAHGPYRHFCLY